MRRAFLLALLPFAFACGHTETYEAMFRVAEPPTGHPVELYMADQPIPTRTYYEIAFVQAVGFGDEAHPENVAKALGDKASALGCDAVVRLFLDQGYSRANASGVCVKWVGPGPSSGLTSLPTQPSPPRHPSQQFPEPAPVMEPLPSYGPR